MNRTAGSAARGWYVSDPAKPDDMQYWNGRRWTRLHGRRGAVRALYGDEPATAPWWQSWPMIMLGFAFFVLPGVVLLWVRRGPQIAVKIAATALGLPLLFSAAAVGSIASPDAPAPVAAPSISASPTPTPEPSPPQATPTPVASPTPTPTPSPSFELIAVFEAEPGAITAAEAAAALVVKGRAPKTGYSREMFGSGWVDVDRNGCDTRNDMLRLRLTGMATSGTCTVLSGTLNDPYTGTLIRFEKGGDSEVDIDHIVALSDAWQKGAAPWQFAKRVAFANDPLNLEPVDASANRQKGDGDTATWLPSNKTYRCEYVARQVAVKTKYEIWVTEAEQDAMLRVLDDCPGYLLPGPGSQPVIAENTGGPAPTQEPEPAPDPAPEPAKTTDAPEPVKTTDPPKTDVYYANCTEVRAAGAAPIYRGDPGFQKKFDRDGDGVGCE